MTRWEKGNAKDFEMYSIICNAFGNQVRWLTGVFVCLMYDGNALKQKPCGKCHAFNKERETVEQKEKN